MTTPPIFRYRLILVWSLQWIHQSTLITPVPKPPLIHCRVFLGRAMRQQNMCSLTTLSVQNHHQASLPSPSYRFCTARCLDATVALCTRRPCCNNKTATVVLQGWQTTYLSRYLLGILSCQPLTTTLQPFLRFNPVFVKCRQTSYHSFRQSISNISKWLPEGLAFLFRFRLVKRLVNGYTTFLDDVIKFTFLPFSHCTWWTSLASFNMSSGFIAFIKKKKLSIFS